MRFISYIASLILHIGLVIAIIVWPSKILIRPERPIKISLTMESVGGNIIPSAVLGPKFSIPEQASVIPQPPVENISLPLPSVEPIQTQPELLQAHPELISEQLEQPLPVQLPLKTENKNMEKVIEQIETKQSLKKKIDNDKKIVEASNKASKREEVDSNALLKKKKALADAKKKAQLAKTSSASSVSSALAGFKKQTAKMGGGGGINEGSGGGGLHDVYAGLVMMTVRPNWSIPTYSRENLVALVHVRIDPEGNVLSCIVERSSGRADFDASAVNAVIRTKVLPIPPTPAQQDMIIVFNALEVQ